MRPSEYSTIPQDGEDLFSSGDPQHVKPEVYYGDGPFDPPSSDDENDELLEKETTRETLPDVEVSGLRIGSSHKVSCVQKQWWRLRG